MSITIRTPTDSDFFAWLGVYESYTQLHDVKLTDQHALVLWSWLSDAQHEENALIALDGDDLVGLVHFREFARPLEADRSVFVDDLYVAEGASGNGIEEQLVGAVATSAREKGFGVVRFSARPDDERAQKLYEKSAKRADQVIYELDLKK